MRKTVIIIILTMFTGLLAAGDLEAKSSVENRLNKSKKIQMGLIVALDLANTISVVSQISDWESPVLVEYRKDSRKFRLNVYRHNTSFWRKGDIDAAKKSVDYFRDKILSKSLRRIERIFEIPLNESNIEIFYHYSKNKVLKFDSGVYLLEN